MKSAEFGKFPGHITLPNAWEPFWWQKVSYRKRFVTLWEMEWMNEWMNEWMSEWVSEWVSECEWVSGKGSQWASEPVSQWVSESVSERVSGWMNELYISVSF